MIGIIIILRSNPGRNLEMNWIFKACANYFFFSLNDIPSKTEKNILNLFKKVFSFLRYSFFVFLFLTFQI